MTDQPKKPTLAQRFQRAIEEHLAEKGGGFAEGFVAYAETVDADGETCVYLVSPDLQRANRSFGMAQYLGEYWRNECRHIWDAANYIEDGEDDE